MEEDRLSFVPAFMPAGDSANQSVKFAEVADILQS